ncbi:VanZ family protein [Pseudomonas sp. BN417]|uniref:VanZ family protein n=1 Tax=Pseudomonas sp. BN417 TaxID=2567890 RepID=UPI0024574B29|nr:VanZ family protein [Pseudomonas sp. BN417]MDH4554629.1 VanZ family protein [Pseudomonas sp. BN417]
MRYLRVLPFLAVLAIILFAGLKPEPLPEAVDQQDKLHHLLGFAALMVTSRLAFPRSPFIWLLAFSLGTGLLIELGQGLQPSRTPSVSDMLANTLGVLLGWICALRLQSGVRGRFAGAARPEGQANKRPVGPEGSQR